MTQNLQQHLPQLFADRENYSSAETTRSDQTTAQFRELIQKTAPEVLGSTQIERGYVRWTYSG